MASRTATGVQFLSGEGAIKGMADLLTTQGKRSDAVIYLDNWFMEHDMKIPGGGTLDSLLRSCATKGATIRALVWNAIIPRSLPSRLARPALIPAALWDKIVWDAISRFFPQPKINIDAVDFIKTLPGAMAILDDVTLPLGSHHQKILVVANPKQTVAFIGGVEWNSNRLPPRHRNPARPCSTSRSGSMARPRAMSRSCSSNAGAPWHHPGPLHPCWRAASRGDHRSRPDRAAVRVAAQPYRSAQTMDAGGRCGRFRAR